MTAVEGPGEEERDGGRPSSATGERPAVFVDRDGTLLRERAYVDDPDDVDLVPGTPRALRALRRAGYALVVVTNQSGIARGLYTEEEYHAVARRVDAELAAAGAGVDATRYCPHHPDFTGPCECRKPGTLMHRTAARELDLALDRSWFVGDKVKDVLPARKLGGEGILVRTGFGRREEPDLPEGFRVAEDLPDAVRIILEACGDAGGEGDAAGPGGPGPAG